MSYSDRYYGHKDMSPGQRKYLIKTLRGFGWEKRKWLDKGGFGGPNPYKKK